ncbi:MAG: GNAT family N-acetyltransferase [Ruminococcus sp.]|nr:GNAT family N-acetyltransferase [Ruminococcus sp.]
MTIRKYKSKDLQQMILLWNEVVEDGIAFPQEEILTEETGTVFFAEQSYCGVAVNDSKDVVGLYILHPNNVGRCGHICNASYAVSSKCRGQHIGEKLVLDCIVRAKEIGFTILQFNAVVESNIHARHLYERIGFTQLGVIPNGFRMKDGHFETICPYFLQL